MGCLEYEGGGLLLKPSGMQGFSIALLATMVHLLLCDGGAGTRGYVKLLLLHRARIV